MEEINKILQLFNVNKPIIGTINLKGENDTDTIERAKMEIDIYLNNDIDALLIENYYGSLSNIHNVLSYLRSTKAHIIYGVNILRSFFIHSEFMSSSKASFTLAKEYDAKFVQIDPVACHLSKTDDTSDELDELKQQFKTIILGNIHLAGQMEKKDLLLVKEKCDAIVLKDDNFKKIEKIRKIIASFPLIIRFDMISENCLNQLSIADACIYDGNVSTEYVKKIIEKVKMVRNKPF